MITRLDFVAVPSTDAERTRSFYVDNLGLRPDDGHLALHVDDIERTRSELESGGVEFLGETLDTGVCRMEFFTDPDGNDLMLHHQNRQRRPDERRAGFSTTPCP